LEKGKQLAVAAVSSAIGGSGKKPKKKGKVKKIIGWFLVPVVAFSACTALFGEDEEEYTDADLCYDDNLDNLCDDTFELRSSDVYKVTEAGKKMYVRLSSQNTEDDDLDFGG
jgi:hypothetical protein